MEKLKDIGIKKVMSELQVSYGILMILKINISISQMMPSKKTVNNMVNMNLGINSLSLICRDIFIH